MESRPKIQLKRTIFEKLFDLVALLLFVLSISYIIIEWSSIPESVPTHYNIKGEPDDWGAKWQIFIPLVIGIIMWIGLSFLEKYPETHNYISLTKENVERQYKNSQLLLNVMKNEMLIFFSLFSINDVLAIDGKQVIMGIWTMPIFLIVIFGSMAFFIIRAIRM